MKGLVSNIFKTGESQQLNGIGNYIDYIKKWMGTIWNLCVINNRFIFDHLIFEMASAVQEMGQLKEIIATIDDKITKASEKNKMQKEIFVEYIHIFQKLAQKLAILSNKINDQILNPQDPNDETIANIYQHLSNTLLRMADCSRNVAVKAKNQVHDPMKLFCDNYNLLNTDLLKRLKTRQVELNEKFQQLNRNKESYYSASQKLDKHKKGQSKTMAKIENGDLLELEKFNSTIKKITENIKHNQEQYQGSVNLVNLTLHEMRKELNEMVSSLTYNEESRMSFCKKSLVSSIKIMEDFSLFYDSSVDKKIDQSLKLIQSQKGDSILKKKLTTRIALLSNSKLSEQFVSYDDLIKMKRKKSLQEEFTYLNQIFQKVREDNKDIIDNIINPWFKTESSPKKKNLQSPGKTKKIRAKDIDEVKEKILSVQPYSYYFIEEVYRRILEMSSFYLKLVDQDFLLLLNMFNTITNNLELIENTNNSALGIQFLYKMIQVSMRILWKKNYNSNKGQPIELLCQQFGKKSKNLSNQIVLKKLYLYVQKKKVQKKSGGAEESKGMMNTFFKGFGAVMNRKKDVTLTEDENFNCLTEMTQIMANLLTPSEVSIPFLKSLLGKNQNSRSFDYLKSILLDKKDQQERQKIFFRTEIKGKKQQEIRKVLENKKIAEYAITIAAKRGFFGKADLNLRLINSTLKNVHLEIISRLDMKIEEKWIHLIPFRRELDYVDMKREVAEQSVPSAIQEIITLDVNRSLHNHGQYLSPTILHSLLRTYAFFHKDISYCQGMNYIAGYLFVKTRKEEEAYRIFEYLMEVRFKELFANEFQVLKIKMYQFERLLSIFHPEISDHFKKQVITPECYIVSWIITLFASSYQYTMESYLIDLLWERFIVWGWREFFRFVLSLFSLYKEELMELTYDRALHFLGEMGRNQMFLSSHKQYLQKYPENIVEEGMQDYPISEQLLLALQKQYKLT